jgi:hypothetical protein
MDFNNKIKKRRATKIEEIPAAVESPKEAKAKAKRAIANLEHKAGPLGIIEPFQYTNYEWGSSRT